MPRTGRPPKSDEEIKINNRFSSNLKKEMEERNMKATHLARRLNTSEANVSRWINAKTYPSEIMLLAISKILGKSVEELNSN